MRFRLPREKRREPVQHRHPYDKSTRQQRACAFADLSLPPPAEQGKITLTSNITP
jgi:hypothetical protein